MRRWMVAMTVLAAALPGSAAGAAASGGVVTSAPIVIDLLAYLPACP